MEISVPNLHQNYAAQLSELSSRAHLRGRGANRRWHVAATEIDYNQAVPVIQHSTLCSTPGVSAGLGATGRQLASYIWNKTKCGPNRYDLVD